MNHGRQDRSLTLLSMTADAEAEPTADAKLPAGRATAPRARWTRPGRIASADRQGVIEIYRTTRPRWSRPRRALDKEPIRRPEPVSGIPLPRLPEGIPDEDGHSLGALAAVLVAYHRTVPAALRDEYVRQLMKFAGEKAGQLLRMHLDGQA